MSTATLPPPVSDFETALKGDDRLELRLWLRLLTCSNLIEARVRRGLRDQFDITLPRFDLLAQLDRAPAGLTLSELSRRLMVSNGNMTGLVERLCAEGLIESRPQAGDRRAQRVRLTDAGKRAFDTMTPIHEAWIATMLDDLDRRDMAALYELLGRLKQGVAASPETPASPVRAGRKGRSHG
ncbi:MAG: MarR family winged helix-turn-helix transcriptional regulator [Pseudomonadota bacterium]